MEITAHRKDGKCFHYNEFIRQGHKLVCKHLFSIEVLCVEEDDQLPDGAPEQMVPPSQRSCSMP
jgi:hypothetical protein